MVHVQCLLRSLKGHPVNRWAILLSVRQLWYLLGEVLPSSVVNNSHLPELQLAINTLSRLSYSQLPPSILEKVLMLVSTARSESFALAKKKKIP